MKPWEVREAIGKIEARGRNETAHRILGVCSQVFNYARANGIIEHNPVTGLRGALAPVVKKHFAAVTEPDQVAKLLRTLEGYEGSFTVRQALRLAPLFFVRPGELIKAKWEEIDFEKRQWRYFVTKTKTPHIVPLSTQAVTILRELQEAAGDEPYVFPSGRTKGRSLSNMALLGAMRSMEISKDEMTPHGFRAMARTILREVLKFDSEVIERQLCHSVRSSLGRAYDRTEFIDERTKMMQDWADYLDGIKNGNV